MIEDVLKERASRYGTFADHAEIAQGLQEVLWDCPNWHIMPLDTRQALIVITDKMARMLNGDAGYDDNWVDIIGYATLVLNRIREDQREETNKSKLEKLVPSGVVSTSGGTLMNEELFPTDPTEWSFKETSRVLTANEEINKQRGHHD